MIEKSLAQPARPNSDELNARCARGLALYRERRHEIQDLGEGLYLVPSSDGRRAFSVQYGEQESCSCDDARRHPDSTCKHVFALGVRFAKRRARRGTCSGCGERFLDQDLVEAFEENHSGFWFDGDRFCVQCASENGISY